MSLTCAKLGWAATGPSPLVALPLSPSGFAVPSILHSWNLNSFIPPFAILVLLYSSICNFCPFIHYFISSFTPYFFYFFIPHFVVHFFPFPSFISGFSISVFLDLQFWQFVLVRTRLQLLKFPHEFVISKTIMWSLVFALENILPHCLEKTQLQWVQWIYALWQLLRGNPLILLVLSFLPYYVRQKLKKKTVVVIGEAKDIDMTYKELEEYIKYHEVINMEVVSCERPRDFHLFYKVRHNGYYYITHENTMCELAKCSMLFGANVIFVEKLLPVSATLAVGKLLTQTEAYEKIMSKRYHCSRGPKVVVPTSLIYSDFSSKFWAVLSTLPILLQAKDYKRTSNLLILLIILLDLNRIWLYALYDRFFNRFTRFVKLNIFKGGTHYYNFFSIFSSRWRYSDTVKKHAYLAKPGEEMNIRWYCKLKSLDDIEIVGWDLWNHDPNDQHIFLELFPDNSAYRAECKLMQYNEYVAKALLKKHVYVP